MGYNRALILVFVFVLANMAAPAGLGPQSVSAQSGSSEPTDSGGNETAPTSEGSTANETSTSDAGGDGNQTGDPAEEPGDGSGAGDNATVADKPTDGGNETSEAASDSNRTDNQTAVEPDAGTTANTTQDNVTADGTPDGNLTVETTSSSSREIDPVCTTYEELLGDTVFPDCPAILQECESDEDPDCDPIEDACDMLPTGDGGCILDEDPCENPDNCQIPDPCENPEDCEVDPCGDGSTDCLDPCPNPEDCQVPDPCEKPEDCEIPDPCENPDDCEVDPCGDGTTDCIDPCGDGTLDCLLEPCVEAGVVCDLVDETTHDPGQCSDVRIDEDSHNILFGETDGTTSTTPLVDYPGAQHPQQLGSPESRESTFAGDHFHDKYYHWCPESDNPDDSYYWHHHGGSMGVSAKGSSDSYDCAFETTAEEYHAGGVMGDGEALWRYQGVQFAATSRSGCTHDGSEHGQTAFNTKWKGGATAAALVDLIPAICGDLCDVEEALLIILDMSGSFGNP